uniref:Secreted protein n=1 Tax=Anopheles albimanus TaxID=7167 RepID=A0A182FXX3_ANOAL
MHRSVVVVLLLSATIALSIASPRRIHTGVEGDATAQTVPDVTAAPNAEAEAPATPEQLEPLANGETNAEEEEEEEAYHEEEAVVPHVAAKEHVSVAENAVEKVEPAVAETQEPAKTHDEAPLAAAAA